MDTKLGRGDELQRRLWTKIVYLLGSPQPVKHYGTQERARVIDWFSSGCSLRGPLVSTLGDA
jgi:hypothetical protein